MKISASMCQMLGWTVLVRVDNRTYDFLGEVVPSLVNGSINGPGTSLSVASPSTLLTGNAGPMQVNLSFLSPIEVRSHSSVTFNVYICVISRVTGSSYPSHSHIWHSPQIPRTAHLMLCKSIQTSLEVRAIILQSPSFLLSLVTEWSSRDASQRILSSPTSNADVVLHNVTLQTPAEFTEISDQAQWGTIYYAMKAVS